MPRGARKKSSSGGYHLVARGINKQRIFEDEEDYLIFKPEVRY
jgi:putative transposase